MNEPLPMPVHRLGCMLRLHRRHEYLDKVFETFRALAKKRRFFLSVMVDRPSPEVASALKKQINQAPNSWIVDVLSAPFALLNHSENWMGALSVHYGALLSMASDYLDAAMLWDDDMWLDKAGRRELNGHLDIFDVDRIEAQSRFLWDTWDNYNDRFPAHWQAVAFRSCANDKFPQHYTTHCPHRTARSEFYTRMKNPLWNAGYLRKEERAESWNKFRRAGKIDRHTLTLTKEPILKKAENGTIP